MNSEQGAVQAPSAHTALVTGATGFVGRHLVRHLLNQGWRVHAIVRPGSDTKSLRADSESLQLHTYDGGMEPLRGILEESRPDLVFHLASLVLAENRPEDIEPLIQSNLLFGTQLVEAMTDTGARALVNTGTFWQHYENREYSPVNLYAATKQAFEALLQYYVEARNLRVITLKLFDTYGPDDPRPKLINLLKQAAAKNEVMAMSPGGQYIELVHVRDVVEAFRLSGERLLDGSALGHERYAVSSGQPLLLRDLVEFVREAMGRNTPIAWGARPYRAREVMEPWRGPWLPGWQPTIRLSQGLSQCFNLRHVADKK